jgi:hypothetical protein
MRIKCLAIIATFIFTSVISFAQKGKIEGKVIDSKSGQPLIGVSVLLKGSNSGVATDIDGHYLISTSTTKKITLVFSYNGTTKEISDIEVNENKIAIQDVVIEQKEKTGQAVVVRSVSAKKETTAALISFQKNTNTVASVISAEAIRRSPDKNTGEALKRVPGTSVQEGKYLVVRGLSDRYNQAMLNGILLSSTEPDRKTFSYDIFPAAMIDNIILNKAFVPELPGEWAGGLVQVQTKDIPSADFVNIQMGAGFNTQTIGKEFLQTKGGKLDWLGIEDGTRALPSNLPTKSGFASLTEEQKNEFGKKFRNTWSATSGTAPLNKSFQINTGLAGKIFNKKAGAVLALIYNETNRRLAFENSIIANNAGKLELFYQNNKYSREVLAGTLANFTLQLNSNNRVSFKNILNINTSDFVIDRYNGRDYILGPNNGDKVKAQELGFKQNTFFNTQLVGEHSFPVGQIKFKWYGGFNILDQYIPDQRRLFYTQAEDDSTGVFYALIGAGSSQKSGSIFYSNLSDYIYNAGGDITKSFNWLGNKQSMKAGYLFQVKDRLFDSRPFFVNTFSNAIRTLGPDEIFAAQNFGTTSDKVQFGELTGKPYRYIANTIMNAGYLQLDNQFAEKLRVVWGVRVEDFDQLIGSVNKADDRFVNTRVTDFLPGINITYKLNAATNIRLSGSQTVARPEFRELSPFAFYDFELNAQVVGQKDVVRTKISNMDLRYELYPRAGELITVGLFYKYFKNPIEYYFNISGPATYTFNVANTAKATALGAEFEFRKKLDVISGGLKNFTITGNISYIYSKVKDDVSLNRPLQGQSPYLINTRVTIRYRKDRV